MDPRGQSSLCSLPGGEYRQFQILERQKGTQSVQGAFLSHGKQDSGPMQEPSPKNDERAQESAKDYQEHPWEGQKSQPDPGNER